MPGNNREIQAMPVPLSTTVETGQITTEDGRRIDLVLLTVESANGTFRFFLNPEHAAVVGDEITRAGKMAATGLLLPPTT